MTKEQFYSIITALLTVVGTFLIGKNIWGQPVDTELWQTITGAVLAVAGLVMSFLDKNLTIEKWQGIARTTIMAVGGVLIGIGRLTPEALETWIGIITSLIPMLYTWLSKKKNEQIQAGEINVRQLTTNRHVR